MFFAANPFYLKIQNHGNYVISQLKSLGVSSSIIEAVESALDNILKNIENLLTQQEENLTKFKKDNPSATQKQLDDFIESQNKSISGLFDASILSLNNYIKSNTPQTTITPTTTTQSACPQNVYAQTLFLGCTVKSYNCSLGWGAESSKLTVDLIYDTCVAPAQVDKFGSEVVINGLPDNHFINGLADNNIFQKDINNNPIVPAKVYYVPVGGRIVSKYWAAADPGFYADLPKINGVDPSIDIVGCAVYFRFGNFEFNGIVKSWENSGGQGGTKSYTVQIESPSFLLNQTQMILSDYNGAIFVKSDSWPPYGFPKSKKGEYIGSIAQQNIPNVINVYGYLEDVSNINTNLPVDSEGIPVTQYGRSQKNDEGMRAAYILAAIQDLLNSKDPYTKQKILRYAPFGRVIGPAPVRKTDAADIFKAITDFPTISFDMGLIKPTLDPAGQYRMPYSVNILDLYGTYFPDYYRIDNSTMSVIDFISNVADSTGKEFFISMDLQIVGSTIYPQIKLNTISRLNQPAEGAVQSFIDYTKQQNTVLQSYTKGEEYNNTRAVRSMYIGGKQQRLYQVRNTKYSTKSCYLRYNAFTNKFANVNHGDIQQEYRLPNAASLRNPLSYTTTTQASTLGRVEAFGPGGVDEFKIQEKYQDPYATSAGGLSSLSFSRGNYLPIIKVDGDLIFKVTQFTQAKEDKFCASDNDAICPYFGTDSLTGYIRRVFHNRSGFFVEFTLAELATVIGRVIPLTIAEEAEVLSGSFNNKVYVSESEIRAAMAGDDQYIGFISTVINDASIVLGNTKGAAILDIWSKVIVRVIGNGNFAFRAMAQGITQTSNKFSNTFSGTDSVPMSDSSSYLAENLLSDILLRLQTFFKEIGDECYGRKFMVNTPYPQAWRDTSNAVAITSTDMNNRQVVLNQSSVKTYYSYEPADFAWEEYGNYIDDVLIVGQQNLDLFTKENGAIEPILGYHSSVQFNYCKALNYNLLHTLLNRSKTLDAHRWWKFNAVKQAGVAVNANDKEPNQPQQIPVTSGLVPGPGSAWPASLPNANFWEPLLSHNADEQLIVSLKNNNLTTSIKDAFEDYDVPDNTASKIYVKGNMEKEIYTYLKQDNLTAIPKLIVSTKPVFINSLSVHARSVVSVATEFLAEIYGATMGLGAPGIPAMKLTPHAMVAQKVLASCAPFYATNQQPNTFGANNFKDNTPNFQFLNMTVSPKAAVPAFAAIPIVLNNAVYGPWISAPDLQQSDIFPNVGSVVSNRKLENLVGGVKVEINNDLVPWNYGGMRNLDEAALILGSQDNDYQLKSETGQITIYGVPSLPLGSELKATSYAFRGPTVNNIQVQIGENGPTTTYSFRTFTRKFTLFNKESADRIKLIGQNSVKFHRELRQQNRLIAEKSYNLSIGMPSYSASKDSKLTQYSPMTLMVGYSAPYLSSKITKDSNFDTNNKILSLGNKYESIFKPKSSGYLNIRQVSTVSIQDARELPQEFDNLYSTKSIMSLDGLYAPVSFYPTLNNSTVPYKPYISAKCPLCEGTKKYVTQDGAGNNVTLDCNMCNKNNALEDIANAKDIVTPKYPPHILTSGTDDSIIKDIKKITDLISTTTVNQGINYINLNPIIMPVGELRNTFAQSDDYNAHSIEIVARSMAPMKGSLSFKDNLNIEQGGKIDDVVYQKGLEYKDQNSEDCDIDWNNALFESQLKKEKVFQIPNNYRFLAHRGPMVMAGWGFDIDGYPVPNASGEPNDYDSNGFPIRDNTGRIIGKNQVYNPASGAKDDPMAWSPPYKEKNFYKGWGLRQDLWPVGPIDLRWDYSRKVWIPGDDKYDNVYVQLEDDLLPTFPARAYLDDIGTTAPLPSGLRRMIFVKDPLKTYGAPRGAKLLCSYNKTTGFYEPVNRANIIASGNIQNNTMATIYNTYTKGSTDSTGSVDPIQIRYNNALNFDIGQPNQMGLFMFMGSEWILFATKSC